MSVRTSIIASRSRKSFHDSRTFFLFQNEVWMPFSFYNPRWLIVSSILLKKFYSYYVNYFHVVFLVRLLLKISSRACLFWVVWCNEQFFSIIFLILFSYCSLFIAFRLIKPVWVILVQFIFFRLPYLISRFQNNKTFDFRNICWLIEVSEQRQHLY